jgi:hypothetical protein
MTLVLYKPDTDRTPTGRLADGCLTAGQILETGLQRTLRAAMTANDKSLSRLIVRCVLKGSADAAETPGPDFDRYVAVSSAPVVKGVPRIHRRSSGIKAEAAGGRLSDELTLGARRWSRRGQGD